MSKKDTLQLLLKLEEHYLNTLTIDETDRAEYEKCFRAIEWVRKQ